MARPRHWLLRPTAAHADIPLPFVIVVLLLVRVVGATWSVIADCDETFNYWEALHLVLYGRDQITSQSLQTWEYSPEFAIRSWAYILLHAVVAWPAKAIGLSKVSATNGKLAACSVASVFLFTAFLLTSAALLTFLPSSARFRD